MDGSNAAFLFDEPLLSQRSSSVRNGILYIEDFDDLLTPVLAGAAEGPAPPVPMITEADLRAAHAMGREAGLQAALAEEHLLQSQLRVAALQSVADELSKAEAGLVALARGQAEQTARLLIGILHAALPATMRVHGLSEIEEVVRALLPGLRCEPELRVRAHPAMADLIRESLVARLPDEGCVLSVHADAALGAGDVRVAWKDGHAVRDCGAIWAEICVALAPLDLLLLKDIDFGK